MEEIVRYKHCFVCGEENPHGLRIRFFSDGTEARTELIAADWQEGYRGMLHGGIIATILDEVMIKALLAAGLFAVTAELSVRYHRPTRSGERLTFRGRQVDVRGKVIRTTGEAVAEDGTIKASARGVYIQAKPELQQRLASSIDPNG